MDYDLIYVTMLAFSYFNLISDLTVKNWFKLSNISCYCCGLELLLLNKNYVSLEIFESCLKKLRYRSDLVDSYQYRDLKSGIKVR